MASELFIKPGQVEQEIKWAKIWFRQLRAFHGHERNPNWQFTSDDVIAFLKSKKDNGVPAWKRMKIIRGLMVYRRMVKQQPDDDLVPLQKKMEEIILIERARDEGYDSIEETIGKIDPREPDAIQEFRRALRKTGKSLGTERAYVGKVKAFMADRAHHESSRCD